jgi:hypothetical protein
MTTQAKNNIDVLFVSIEDRSAWNELVSGLNANNLYNSWGWGEYKAKLGWKINRIEVKSAHDNRTIGLFQLQIKSKWLLNVFFIQGGLYATDNEATYLTVLNELCRRYGGSAWRNLITINYYAEHSENAFRALLGARFVPLINGSMYTLIVDTVDIDNLYSSGLSGNWRHNLKRARKNADLCVLWPTSRTDRLIALAKLDEMYFGLGLRKNFDLPISVGDMIEIIADDPNYLICEARHKGEAVAVRIGYKCHDHVIDLLAASNDGAKSNYANYLLIWSLIEKCNGFGFRYFECGGVDPAGNLGVYNFKRGLGGRLHSLGPLWVYSKSRALRLLALLSHSQ